MINHTRKDSEMSTQDILNSLPKATSRTPDGTVLRLYDGQFTDRKASSPDQLLFLPVSHSSTDRVARGCVVRNGKSTYTVQRRSGATVVVSPFGKSAPRQDLEISKVSHLAVARAS